ncbi:DUF3866 family protein [Aneurinibacillus sp. REN35]|uniref:DUF3866 family protein n=1 Tax=Aneurinibacillus sp. REN35 TaxID=3237286 RepID=UPI003528C799
MIAWSYGTVTHIVYDEELIQELTIHMEGEEPVSALNYPALTGRVQVGERVIVNTTAVALELGSGGKHVVAVRVDADGKPLIERSVGGPYGHIMRLRYTPFQHAVQAVEEETSTYHEIFRHAATKTLGQIPVVIGETHSMLPGFVLSIRHMLKRSKEKRMPRICYIMSEGGALPLALSDHVRKLQSMGVLAGTITYGHAFGGQTECVNLYTALLAARYVWKADMIVIMPGPGVVGTGTDLGFSGMEQIAIADAVYKLAGRAILIPRVSTADPRERHAGVSHHTLTVLRFAATIPLTINLEDCPHLLAQLGEQSSRHTLVLHDSLAEEEWAEIESPYSSKLTAMGRDSEKEHVFFAHTYYAARLTWIEYEKQRAMQKMDLFA